MAVSIFLRLAAPNCALCENTDMATAYEDALQMAASLSPDDRLRLLRELLALTATSEPTSVLELEGLGAEIWQGIDAQAYVTGERSSWRG
jgi:hypothetical protein